MRNVEVGNSNHVRFVLDLERNCTNQVNKQGAAMRTLFQESFSGHYRRKTGQGQTAYLARKPDEFVPICLQNETSETELVLSASRCFQFALSAKERFQSHIQADLR